MNEGNACFHHVKSVTKPITEIYSYLAAKPNLISIQIFLQKKIAMAITFHLPPWLPLCLKWLRCYHNYRAEKTLVNFTPIECLAVHHVNPLSKICQKCPCTVTETIQQPLQLQSLPGWHMKNTGLSYLFCKMPGLISGLVWRLVRFKSQFNGLSHFSDAENKNFPCS